MPGAQFDSAVDAPERMRNRQPRFNREETEVMSSYTRSRVGEPHGDRLLEWATSPEFRAQQVRYRKMCPFSKAVINEYVPEGVQRVDFTEPLDGCQRLIFFFRSLYDAIKELLKNARFSGRQYTQADVKFHPDGLRAYNTINSGKVFEAAQITAGPGVSPVLLLVSSDSTLVSKSMGGHPILGEYIFLGFVGRADEKIAKYKIVRIACICTYSIGICMYVHVYACICTYRMLCRA